MITIELKTPVSKGERTISSLVFQEPKIKHFVRTDGKDRASLAADRALLSALTGEPESLLDEISIDDWSLIRRELEQMWFRFLVLLPTRIIRIQRRPGRKTLRRRNRIRRNPGNHRRYGGHCVNPATGYEL